MISIHAPARGATIRDTAVLRPCQYFNPRSREGNDYNFTRKGNIYGISIHAPARGAT